MEVRKTVRRASRKPDSITSEAGEAFLSSLLDHRRLTTQDLIEVLHEVQEHYRYLPESVLRSVSRHLDVPLIEVFRVASFFKAFTLQPRGRYLVTLCMGTACNVRGASRLLETAQEELSVEAGETTADGGCTLETVNCLGACAMGPVVVIDGQVHDQVSPDRLRSLLAALRDETAREDEAALTEGAL